MCYAANGKSDYEALKVPTTYASGPFSHGGGGLKMNAAVVAWMNWQAKGNETAGKIFLDPEHTYLKSLGYTEILTKNWK